MREFPQVSRHLPWRSREFPQVSRHLPWRLRESRKSLGIYRGVCGSPASLAAFAVAFAQAAQVSRHLPRRLRRRRKSLGVCRGVSADTGEFGRVRAFAPSGGRCIRAAQGFAAQGFALGYGPPGLQPGRVRPIRALRPGWGAYAIRPYPDGRGGGYPASFPASAEAVRRRPPLHRYVHSPLGRGRFTALPKAGTPGGMLWASSRRPIRGERGLRRRGLRAARSAGC